MSSESKAVEPVLSARGLGKCYQIYRRPQDRLKQAVWGNRVGRKYYRDFWALKDVSFDLMPGEGLGVIGRNGAGKSTLLQIIAGTLPPTEGEVRVRGRVAAMLELGSGFNPEFTGRENVLLNGMILGLPRRTMEQRLDEIADFADIGEFMDRPLKTYSSGMRARLAFAVSTAVDPDILIVDEILSVGDIGFKQRCVSRMRRLRDNGLTLLLVSHTPASVRSLCDRGLFLADGRLAFFGNAEPAVNRYLRYVREMDNEVCLKGNGKFGSRLPFETRVPGQLRYGTGHAQIESVRVLNGDGEPAREFRFGEDVVIEARIRAKAPIDGLSVSFLVRDQFGVDLMGTATHDERITFPRMEPELVVTTRFAFRLALGQGHYGVCLAAHRPADDEQPRVILFDQVDGCAAFRVAPDPDRPVHYRFHQPVNVTWDVSHHARTNAPVAV